MMGRSLNDKLNTLSETRRQRIMDEAERLKTEYLTLQDLRKKFTKLTQAQIADKLEIRQATVAKMEGRPDLLISTLRNYIEAMGGKLNLIAEFPDSAPVSLRGLSETESLTSDNIDH